MADRIVTRQSSEILHAREPSVRVSRHYLQVLTSTTPELEPSVSHSLGITDAAVASDVIRNVSVNNTIVMTDDATGWLPIIQESVSHSLGLTDVAGRLFTESVSDPMTFLDAVLGLVIFQDFQPVAHSLGLTQSVFAETGLFHFVSSSLGITDSVAAQYPYHINVYQSLNLGHFARSTERHERLSQILTLSDVAGLVREFSLESIMTLTDEAERIFVILQNLGLTQGLTYGHAKDGVLSEMGITDSVILNAIWLREVVQSLGVGHSMTYWLPSPCGKKQYTPFIGESTVPNQLTPPDENKPYVGGLPEGARFILAHPPLAETTDTVELRAPNMDNRDRLANTRINRETMGGHLSIFTDPNWPQIHTLVLTISGLEKTDIEDLQTFMTAHLGQEISLLDWEGREWVGVITTPNEQAVRDSRVGYTVAIEFEGVLVGSNTPGDAMTISDSVGVELELNRGLTDDLELSDWATFLVETP